MTIKKNKTYQIVTLLERKVVGYGTTWVMLIKTKNENI